MEISGRRFKKSIFPETSTEQGRESSHGLDGRLLRILCARESSWEGRGAKGYKAANRRV